MTIAEGGQATFQVRLKTQPTRDLNISVDKSSALVEIDIDPDTAGRQDGLLRFNQTNQTKIWSEYRTIAVFPKHDSDMNDESTRIRLFASVSGDYSIFNTPSVLGIIPITITDDDKPTPAGTIQVTPAGTLTIDEGDSTGGT
ncbi:MAG: hypothetical protein ISN26_06335, partial [Betaproteobacteria bacterium AqS2]|nr:hypothetical protein [Betaproteobacteria bacterium AqS2]